MFHQSLLGLDSFWLLVFALAWIIPWKGWALWRAARNEHKKWFVALLVVNTFALLEIVYIFLFSEYKKKDACGGDNRG